MWNFREKTSGIVSVINTLWLDSGYMFGVSPRGFLDVSPGVVQRQIPAVQTFMDHRVSPVALQGDRRPWLQVVQVLFPVDAQRRLPMVQTVVGPKRFSSSSTRLPISCCAGRADSQVLLCEDIRAPTVAAR